MKCFSLCHIPVPYLVLFSNTPAWALLLGWIRAEKDTFVFLGEPLNWLLERQELSRFSPLQIHVITHELILINSAADMGAAPCENERDLLSPHHPPSASECLSLAWLGAKGNCLTSLQFLNLSWHWEGEFRSQFYPLDGRDHVDTLPLLLVLNLTGRLPQVKSQQPEKLRVFFFSPPFSFSVFLPPSSHLTPDYFWASDCGSGHCKIQIFFPTLR